MDCCPARRQRKSVVGDCDLGKEGRDEEEEDARAPRTNKERAVADEGKKKEQRGEEKAETKAKLERKKRKRAHKTFTNTNTEPLFPSLYPPD